MRIGIKTVFLVLLPLSHQAIAQGSTGCEALLAQGVYDSIQQTATSSSSTSYHQALCTGTVQQSSGGGSAGGGASIILPGIDIPLGLSFNDAQNFQNTYKSVFCSGLDTSALNNQNLKYLSSVASPVLVQGYNACVAARNKGLQSFVTMAPDKQSVSFEVWFQPSVNPNDSAFAQTISVNPLNASCTGINPGAKLNLNHQTLVCKRTNTAGSTIVFPTTQGDLTASLEPLPPPPSTTQVVMGAFPKGIILPWSDMSVPIPSGWHICDGTFGTPDLTDERYLVGAKPSSIGVRGGANDGYNFAVSGTTSNAFANSDGYSTDNKHGGNETTGLGHTHTYNATTNTISIEPKHQSVVWIMKIN